MLPLTEPGEIAVFNIGVAAILIGVFMLFRVARRPTCPWQRPLRWLAQAPGWVLVPLGAYGIVGLAMMEIREKRVGLGTGTLVAVITATIRALAMAYGRPGRDQR